MKIKVNAIFKVSFYRIKQKYRNNALCAFCMAKASTPATQTLKGKVKRSTRRGFQLSRLIEYSVFHVNN